MKVALLTTPEPSTSPAEAELARVLPELAAHFQLRLFVDRGLAGGELSGCRLEDVSTFDPHGFEQVVYAIGNAAGHGYMLPVIRRVGGVAALFEWNLSQAAHAAYPGLAAGGALTSWLTVREGRAGDGQEPVLNRSVVRYADAFLVPDETLGTRVLEDRNDPTPITVFQASAEGTAATWIEALETFPRHRVARKSVLRSMFDALRRRAVTQDA